MNLLVSATEYGHTNQENAIRRIFIRSLKNHKEKVQESINLKRNMNKEGGNPTEKVQSKNQIFLNTKTIILR